MKKTYWTQCDRSWQNGCSATTQLEKPAHWRCPKCEKFWGPLPPPPRPTAPV